MEQVEHLIECDCSSSGSRDAESAGSHNSIRLARGVAGGEVRIGNSADTRSNLTSNDRSQVERGIIEQFLRDNHRRARVFVRVERDSRESRFDTRAECRIFGQNGTGVSGIVLGRPRHVIPRIRSQDSSNPPNTAERQ